MVDRHNGGLNVVALTGDDFAAAEDLSSLALNSLETFSVSLDSHL